VLSRWPLLPRLSRVFVALLGLLCTAPDSMLRALAGASAQSQIPRFASRIDVIRLDVSVIDNRTGKPVRGLAERDFIVKEDGVRQPIGSFVAEAEVEPPDSASLEAWASKARRVFLIVFGSGYNRHLGPINPYEGAATFIRERLRSNDLVGVLAWNRFTDLSTDHERIAQVIERVQHVSPELEKANIRDRSRLGSPEDYPSPEMQVIVDGWLRPPGSPVGFLHDATAILVGTPEYQRNDQIKRWNAQLMTFDILKVAAGIEYLRRVPGDKHLVLFSEFGLWRPFKLRNEGVGMQLRGATEERRFAARANDAGVALDIILTFGTTSITGPMIASSETVAESSGGQFTSVRTAEQQLARLDEATRYGYLIGYAPTNGDLDGRYRNITVEVARKDITVIYRRGYTARPDPPAIDPRELLVGMRLRDAAASDMPLTDIKVNIKAVPVAGADGAKQVRVDLSIEAAKLALERVGDKWEGAIDMMIVCGDARQNVVGQVSQHMKLSMTNAVHAQVMAKGIPYSLTIPVTVAAARVKAIVYDFNGDRIGVGTALVR
jgi:VWFA-related protein